MPPAPVKASTQEHLDIEDVRDGLAILKDGSACIVLETTAVNFSLLSEGEQDAIIYAYAGLLNSLTFPVQIVIQSQKKDINAYLNLLAAQKQKIKNPLLKNQLDKYYAFVQKTVAENEVLDKKFYLVIPFSALELGVTSTLSSSIKKTKGLPFDKDYILTKAKAALAPKRDHLIKQLTRLGLKTKQLTTPAIIKLLFSYYNPGSGSVDFGDSGDYNAPMVEAAVSQEAPPQSDKNQNQPAPAAPNASESTSKTPQPKPPVAPSSTPTKPAPAKGDKS